MMMRKYVKRDHAKYRVLDEDTMFRVQTAHIIHECDSEDCFLGGRILPYQKYVRVYYDADDEFDKFHYACFKEEFKDDLSQLDLGPSLPER